MKRKIIFLLILIILQVQLYAQSGAASCNVAEPFCTGVTYAFPMGTNTSSEQGPDYGCLISQPNPYWYYFRILDPGNITIRLTSPTGNDIDFACWGPFNSPTAPCTSLLTAFCTSCPNNTTLQWPNCEYPSGNLVDCSYDPGYSETVHISNALTGQYYLLLITNYSNQPGNIMFSQTNAIGTPGVNYGTTDCNMCGCDIYDISINSSLCNGLNSYSLSGTVFLSLFSSGTLIVEHQLSGITQTFQPPFGSSVNFTFPSLPLAGSNHRVKAYFTNDLLCAFTKTYAKPSVPELALDSVKPTCGLSNGSIMVTVTGGLAPYDYYWSTGQVVTGSSSSSNILNNIPSGTYFVTVVSSGNCGISDTLLLADNDAAIVDLDLYQGVTCHGSCNGQLTATVQQTANPPYDYYWSSGQNIINTSLLSNNQVGLCPGYYTVTLTNSAGCNSIAQYTLPDPPAHTCVMYSVPPGCACSNGHITALPSGGEPPYSYLWSTSPAQTVQTAAGLPSGIYTVTVVDNNNCQIILSDTLIAPVPFSVTTSCTNNTCYGGNSATATVNPVGGNAPFTYLWSSSPQQTMPTAVSLGAGNYTVTVTAANGCTSAGSVTIGQPSAPIDINATVLQNASCFGANDGLVSAAASDGLPPYQFLWSNGTTGNTAGYGAGTFTVTVTDSNQCNNIDTFTVTQPSEIILLPSQVNPDCGMSNGSAVVSISSGGSPPYSYLWSNGFSLTDTSLSTSTVSGLTAGSYVVTVVNSDMCTATQLYILVNSNAPVLTMHSLVANPCNGDCDASVSVSLSGTLNPPFSYSWSTGENQNSTSVSDTINGLCAGDYYVTITDNAGCIGINSQTVSEPALFTSQISVVTPVQCYGMCNGSLIANTGGNNPGPLTYLWMPGGNTTATASGLCAGTATVTITNVNGCTVTSSYTISQPPMLTVAITSVTDNYCAGNSNGTATAEGSGGTPPYQFLWGTTPPQITETATGLAQGTYYVNITDNNGCVVMTAATVYNQAGSPINLNIVSVVNASCYGASDGSAMASVSGGYPPFSYLWNTVPANTTFYASDLCAGNYTLTVTDVHSCYTTTTVTITEPAQTVSSFVYTTNQGTAVFVNQSSPGSYYWTFGDSATSTDTDPTHEYLLSGNYNACLLVYTACDTSVSCQQVPISIVSMDKSRNENILVYPNPTGDVITVDFGKNRQVESFLKLTDKTGRVVFSGVSNSLKVNIDVSGLAQGMYFLSINGNVVKVIIQH